MLRNMDFQWWIVHDVMDDYQKIETQSQMIRENPTIMVEFPWIALCGQFWGV